MGRLSRRFPINQNQRNSAGRDPDVGEVEDAGAKIAQAEIHEVRDVTIEQETVENITQAAGDDEGESEKFERAEGGGILYCINRDSGEKRKRQHAENPEAGGFGQAVAETQGGAGVFDVLQTKNIVEIRAGMTVHQALLRHLLGRLVPADQDQAGDTEEENFQRSFHPDRFILKLA